MAAGHAEHHGNPIPKYLAVFTGLGIATAVEALPLFGILYIPPPFLLALSAVKFAVVAFFFMHLLGDHPIFTRLFFIPLFMATASVMVLMALFHTWTLTYQETPRGKDPDEIAARYPANYHGQCNSWVVSPLTGNRFCSSPGMGFNVNAAYEVAKGPVVIPEFEGYDAKSPEEKKAVLMTVGANVYSNCAACHMANGEGGPIAPSLKGDAVATAADPTEHIGIVLRGLNGKVIDGKSYASGMQPWAQLSDQQIAAVITYERNSWGNAAGIVEPAQVAAQR